MDTGADTLVEQALAALTSGAGGAEHAGSVVLDEAVSANLRWADNSLTTNGQMHDRRMTVIAHVQTPAGLAVGIATGPLPSRDAVEPLVAEAVAAARASGPAPDPVELTPGEAAEDWTTPAAPGGIEGLAGVAAGLGARFERARGEGVGWYGFAEHIVTTTWLGTTAGVRRRSVDRMGRIEINAKRPRADGGRGASAWVGQSCTDFAEVDVEGLGTELDRRLGWSVRSVDLPAGRYETILPPSAVADLLIYTYWTMSRRDAEEGRNVFAREGGGTRIGERLSPLPITLASDPAAAGLEVADHAVVRAPDSGLTSVFDNGASVQRVDWLRDGVLTDLVTPRTPTGLGLRFPSDNLVAEAGGTGPLEEMIGRTKRGLLLTCLWYLREVDPETLLLTGLTRDGVYLIEDGHVVAEVNNFRFNESPVDLLRRATEASTSQRTLPREWNDWFTRTRMPALRIPDFHMSTVSAAS